MLANEMQDNESVSNSSKVKKNSDEASSSEFDINNPSVTDEDSENQMNTGDDENPPRRAPKPKDRIWILYINDKRQDW